MQSQVASPSSSPAVTPLRFVVCPLCRGSGWSPLVRYDSAGEQGERCPNCAGNGEVLTEGGEL